MTPPLGRISLLWRGDQNKAGTAQNARLTPIFEALAAVGVTAEPAVYSEETADQVREKLMTMDGVLVCVDPLSLGRDRSELDPMLRDVADTGVWVSAHPDI